MLVGDARALLLQTAEDKLRFARSEYLADDLRDADDQALRAYYLRNRLSSACRLVAEALDLIRVAGTK